MANSKTYLPKQLELQENILFLCELINQRVLKHHSLECVVSVNIFLEQPWSMRRSGGKMKRLSERILFLGHNCALKAFTVTLYRSESTL